MGYGKTTHLREYLRGADADTLWQEIPPDGNDSFWDGFCSLFCELDSGRAQSLMHLRLPETLGAVREAVKLIRGIGLPEKTALVIDDYQNISLPHANEFFTQLAKGGIERLHIVLVTRAARFDKLNELALKGILYHLTKETFEFAPKEIITYYKLCGAHVSDSDALRIRADTEGWISALYLILLEYIARGEYTANDSIHALMEKAVYDPLPGETRGFLAAMSIFDTFTLDQAAFLWGESAGAILNELTQSNSFITCGGRLKRYRIHTLFREFLSGMLENQKADRRNGIYSAAARWFTQTGDFTAAYGFYYRCGDFDGLLSALEKDKDSYCSAGGREMLVKYLTECPRSIRARHHNALLVYAMHLFVHKELDLFKDTCCEFIENIGQDKCLEPAEKNRLLGEFELLQSYAEFNDLKKVSQRYQKAWDYLNRPTAVYEAGINSTFGSPSLLSLYYRESGMLSEHIADLRHAMPWFSRITRGQGSGAEDVMEAECSFNRGSFDEAEICAQRALLKASDGGDESIVYSAQYFKLLTDFMIGNLASVMDRLTIMRRVCDDVAGDAFVHTAEICAGGVYAYLDQPGKIPERMMDISTAAPRLRFPAYPFFNVMYGRLLLVRGEYLKLIGSAEHFFSVASVFSNLLGMIYTHIYLAAALNRIYREKEALDNLTKALDIAMPDKQYMLFAENGDFIAPLLETIAARGAYREEIREIMRLFKIFAQSKDEMIRQYFTDSTPVLTPRELEVGRLAAKGLTYNEIGQRLFISHNTVKMILKAVYAKLSADNRIHLRQRLEDCGY